MPTDQFTSAGGGVAGLTCVVLSDLAAAEEFGVGHLLCLAADAIGTALTGGIAKAVTPNIATSPSPAQERTRLTSAACTKQIGSMT